VDPSDEFFYQLEGDMVLEYIGEGGKRERAPIRQGEVLLLPANTPHSPQRPANSVGLVVERVRAAHEPEAYAWYCERCDAKLYDLKRGREDLLLELKRVNEEFTASAARRTCRACGHVQPVPTGPRL
jgi:3-hydroxyanthranilate 3,4-dioxygenase